MSAYEAAFEFGIFLCLISIVGMFGMAYIYSSYLEWRKKR